MFEFKKVESEEDVREEKKWNWADVVKGEYESPENEYSKRNIFTVLLKNLEPNSKYAFRISEPSWLDEKQEIFSYKTFDPSKIKILDGGDVGNNYITEQMNEKVVSKMDADLIMVGGDIAYDNNLPS